jgi:elongation factor Ts
MGAGEDIKTLRERTGAGILDCKKALAESGGDLEKAIDWLRAKGISNAAKKSARAATEGLVVSYIHGGGKIGVLLEVNCETDFVAMNDAFRALCNDIAMHIAASSPEYVSKEDVPADAIGREREVQKQRVMGRGSPPTSPTRSSRAGCRSSTRSPASSSRSSSRTTARPSATC